MTIQFPHVIRFKSSAHTQAEPCTIYMLNSATRQLYILLHERGGYRN